MSIMEISPVLKSEILIFFKSRCDGSSSNIDVRLFDKKGRQLDATELLNIDAIRSATSLLVDYTATSPQDFKMLCEYTRYLNGIDDVTIMNADFPIIVADDTDVSLDLFINFKTLDKLKFVDCTFKNNLVLKAVVTISPTLRVLDITFENKDCKFHTLSFLEFGKMEELHFTKLDIVDYSLLPTLTNLKKFHSTNSVSQFSLKHIMENKSLETLYIRCAIPTLMKLELIEDMKNLKNLHIHNARITGLDDILPKFEQLEVLEFIECKLDLKKTADKVLPNLQKLKTLNLIECSPISDIFRNIAPNKLINGIVLPELEYLSTANTLIDIKVIIEFSKLNPNIKEITLPISYYKPFSSKDLIIFKELIKELEDTGVKAICGEKAYL